MASRIWGVTKTASEVFQIRVEEVLASGAEDDLEGIRAAAEHLLQGASKSALRIFDEVTASFFRESPGRVMDARRFVMNAHRLPSVLEPFGMAPETAPDGEGKSGRGRRKTKETSA